MVEEGIESIIVNNNGNMPITRKMRQQKTAV